MSVDKCMSLAHKSFGWEMKTHASESMKEEWLKLENYSDPGKRADGK
jgi:hypothetical protein